MTLTKTGLQPECLQVRPQTPILAITPHVDVARNYNWCGGETTLVLDLPSTGQTFQSALNVAQEITLVV
jgi:pyruvate kinase